MRTTSHRRARMRMPLPLPLARRAIAMAAAVVVCAPVMAVEAVAAAEPNALRRHASQADRTLEGVDLRPEARPEAEPRVEFDRGFLRAFGQDIDLSRFEYDESVVEGSQPAEVSVNDTLYGTYALTFSRNPSSGRIEPCLPAALVTRFGLDPARQLQPVPEDGCAFLDQLVEGGSYDYDPGEQKLAITVPQAFLLYKVRGYVPPDALDPGINAASFRYNFNYARNDNTGGASGQYLYGSVQSAFNYGEWRFHTFGALNANEGQAARWDHVAAYAQRPIPAMQAEATFGDWNTPGVLFDTTPVRGVNLATDDRMLPDSMRGYAPVIRGVARSNAVVTVRQGSNVVFESNVPPGEFEFRDLFATGYGGDLEVTVTESDGQTQQFTVPYGSIAQLLRADYTKYSLTFGQVREAEFTHPPLLMEGTVQHGLTDDVTLYGGAQITASTYYASVMGGLAVNTPLGALGLDVTQSFTLCEDFGDDCNKQGQSVRASLGKQLPTLGTYFSLVAYRYSSPGYYSLMDALRIREVQLGNTSVEPLRLRDKFDVNVTQNLGGNRGNLFLTGSYGRRWEDNSRSLGFQAGYTNSWGPARYNLSVGRTRNALGHDENSVFLSVTFPLGRSATNPVSVAVSGSRIADRSDMRTSLTGSVGEHGQASYGAWFDAATGGTTAFGGTLGYTGQAAKGSLSYGHSAGSNSVGVNVSGGVLVHGDGVNFASELGDTVALVEAEGASGAHVLPYSRTRIGDNGMAVVPYVTPYQWNNIELDLQGADMGVQVDNTRIVTAPTAGAVVKVKFDSKQAASTVLRLTKPDGSPVPFGATLALDNGESVGLVGANGMIVAANLPERAVLTASWGKAPDQQCQIRYVADAAATAGNSQSVDVRDMACLPEAMDAPEAPDATNAQPAPAASQQESS